MVDKLQLQEVQYKKPEPIYSDKPCPGCGNQTLVHGQIPCPDYVPGSLVHCLVLHYGYICSSCGRIYQ
jgi:hypothetical protein